MIGPGSMKIGLEGFDVWPTGGGCEAWGKKYANGNYTLVTNEGGTELPKVGSCIVGSYNPDETS